jgi:hypothetical protein
MIEGNQLVGAMEHWHCIIEEAINLFASISSCAVTLHTSLGSFVLYK